MILFPVLQIFEWRLKTEKLKKDTLTRFAVSSKSLLACTAKRTVNVCAASIFVTRTGFGRTLINICGKKKSYRFLTLSFSVNISGESSGGARGGRPPLFLDQTEARRAEKIFLETAPGISRTLINSWRQKMKPSSVTAIKLSHTNIWNSTNNPIEISLKD